MKKNKDSCFKIAEYTFCLVEGLKSTLEGKQDEVDSTLLKDIQMFEVELNSVRDRLIKIANRIMGKRFVHALADKETIADCEKQIKNCLDQFNLYSNIHIRQGNMLLLQGQNDLREVLTKVQADSHNQLEVTYDKLEKATPVVPRNLSGREKLIKQAVEHIMRHAQTFLAILGPGGIGKTALALVGILQCLKIQVQKGEGQMETLSNYLQTNTNHTLLILDNLETPWYSKEGRTGVRRVLEKLAMFEHLSIVVTMRGTDGPADLEWFKLGAETGIPTLSVDAAREMFLSITGHKPDLLQNPDKIDELLKKMDFVPLAVKLIAQHAKAIPIQSLLQMWTEEKTAVLREGRVDDHDRLTSVEHSIQLSVKLLEKDTLELLKIISFLPNGIPLWIYNLTNMLPNFKNISTSLRNLLESTLVFNKGEDIKTLAPIREYIQKEYQVQSKDLMSLENFYISWLKTLSGNAQAMQEQVQPHIMNMTKILNTQMEKSIKKEHIEAVKNLSKIQKFNPFVIELIEPILKYLPVRGASELFIEFQFLKIDMLMWMGKWEGAESIVHNIMINNKSIDQEISAGCLQILGKLYGKQSKFREAIEVLLQAQRQFEAIGKPLGVAQCLFLIGDIYHLHSKYKPAIELLTKAQREFEKIGHSEGLAQCLQKIGHVFGLQSKCSEAIKMLFEAKEQFDKIGSTLEATFCTELIGGIYYRQLGKYNEATEMILKAERQYKEIEYPLGVAHCLRSIGHMHYIQGKESEAVKTLLEAHGQFEKLGTQWHVAWSLQLIWYIYGMQGRYDEATKMLTKVQRYFEKIGYSLGIAHGLLFLGEIYGRQGRHSEGIETLLMAQK
ncbi:TPR-like protein, partial [Dendrothele bispora CBS 962.96]